MAKLFNRFDDIDLGDEVEVTFHDGSFLIGWFGGFRRMHCGGNDYRYCVFLEQERSSCYLPTSDIFGILVL